jgi:hypothetical protein
MISNREDRPPVGDQADDEFMNVYRDLCPHYDSEVPVEMFAQRLGWPVARVQEVAARLTERGQIEVEPWAFGTRPEDIEVISGLDHT